MLNSAVGVILPTSNKHRPLKRSWIFPLCPVLFNCCRYICEWSQWTPMLLFASLVRTVSIIKSACCFWRGISGSGRVGPSRPVFHEHAPLLQVAFALGRYSLQKPLSQFFVLTKAIRAFFLLNKWNIYCSKNLDFFGLANANSIATASSWPGSVSIIILRFCMNNPNFNSIN